MTDTVKKDVATHDKKNKSGFLNLKKKLNIPRIYKRLASKLSIHGRHMRSLTNSWNTTDVQCLVLQYELSEMLKELSDAAELARSLARCVSEDLLTMQKDNYFCDLKLSLHVKNEDVFDQYSPNLLQLHSALFATRTSILLPWNNPSAALHKEGEKESILHCNLCDVFDMLPSDTQCIYNKQTKHLKLISQHVIPPSFFNDVVSYVYGRSIGELKTLSSCNISYPTSFSTTEKSQFIYSTNQIVSDIKESVKNFENRNYSPKGNNELYEKRYMDDFCNDMKDLLLSANITGDIKLVFAVPILSSAFSNHSRSRLPSCCFHCHSFVIAARSNFFRNMIQRRIERSDVTADVSDSPFITIELDKKVLSPRYFPVIIYAMYTDELDLQRMSKSFPLINNRSQSESLSTEVKDLMELLHIGRFLEFPFLVQACENALLENLSVGNFTDLLQWSSQAHGSPWLRRQVMRFAKDNFLQLQPASNNSTSGVLYSLSSSEMAEIVSSDFVNSPELEILRTVLKWGEHELLRRIELREPNVVRSHILLNQPSRNLRVSSSKRRELLLTGNNEELHDITSCLLRFVRLRHILPSNHELVVNATRRGVISSPPQHLLEWHNQSEAEESDNSRYWIRFKAGPDFRPPRLFPPYVTETKAALKERLAQDSTENNMRSTRRSYPSAGTPVNFAKSTVPDALYMVGNVRHLSRQTSAPASFCEKCSLARVGITSMATKRLKYIDNCYPVPPPSLASKLIARERFLRQSAWIRRVLQACHSATVSTAYCCCSTARHSFTDVDGVRIRNPNTCNLCRAEGYVRLMVIREYDLPDVAVDVLKRPHIYYDADELMAAASLEVSKTGNRVERLETPAQDQQISASSPKRFEKLFNKKSMSKKRNPIPVKQANFEIAKADCDSSSDLSLSDDSSSDWPFPYRSLRMRDRTQPGSSFWDSDTSIRTPPIRTAVPDVAASADSTMISLRSRLSSTGSSSDSCASVPCRLVAESLPQVDSDSPESTSRSFYTGRNTFTFQSCRFRKTVAPSYAHYLSLRKPAAEKRRSALSNFERLSDLTATNLNMNNVLKTPVSHDPTSHQLSDITKSFFTDNQIPSSTISTEQPSSDAIAMDNNTSFIKETYT